MRTVYTVLVCFSSILTVYFMALIIMAEEPSASNYFSAGLASLSVFIFYHAGKMHRKQEEKAAKEAAEAEEG